MSQVFPPIPHPLTSLPLHVLPQTAGSDGVDQLNMAAMQLARKIEPAAEQASEAILGSAQILQQGATQQGQQLAAAVEEAGLTLGKYHHLLLLLLLALLIFLAMQFRGGWVLVVIAQHPKRCQPCCM
jgi:hypothetical protein